MRPSNDTKPAGINRRTIVAGAAWSIPVIAIATAAPAPAAAAAASTRTTVVEFGKASYTLAGCGVISGITVSVTVNGSPAPLGTTTTVTLPAGYTFIGGAVSPLTITTDATGTVMLPDIKAPTTSPPSSITAVTDGESASAPLVLTAPVGSVLYGVAYVAGAQAVPVTGLPAGYSFSSVRAVSGSVFATLADGSIYVSREVVGGGAPSSNTRWFNTGLSGDVATMMASSHPNNFGTPGEAVAQVGGALYKFNWANNTTAPTITPLVNPPGGAPVRIADSKGVGTIYAESPDGRLWWTPSTGATSGTWTEVTGVPTPVTDWIATTIGNNVDVLNVIGADGNLYANNGSTGARATNLLPRNNAARTWTGPALKFAERHNSTDAASFSVGQLTMFVDSAGGLYAVNAAQNINYGGVLNGQLDDLEVLHTVDAINNNGIYFVVTGGKVYSAGSDGGVPWNFKDITPPASLLNGATIVDAHAASTGLHALAFAMDSNGKMWRSNRFLNGAATWTAVPGYPANASFDGIVQDGQHAYTLSQPTVCA